MAFLVNDEANVSMMWILRSPYILLFGLFLILIYPFHKSDVTTKESITMFCLVVLMLFFGLRGDIGDDYVVYSEIYEKISLQDTFSYGPSFVFLNLIFKLCGAPFHCFLAFCSVVTNVLFVRFLWKSHCVVPFAIAVFFAKWGIINEVDFIRNMIGIVLFLNSIEFILKKKPRMFFTLNLIGLYFHVSSLLFFPLYWILDRRISRQTYIFFFVFSMILFALRLRFLDFIPSHFDCSQYSWSSHMCEYITSFSKHKATLLFWSESFFAGLVVCYFYNHLVKEQLSMIAVNAFLINTLCFGLFSAYWMLASRLANLLGFCYWLLYPIIIFKILKNNFLRFLIFCVMLFFLLHRLISLVSLPQWQYNFSPH